MQRSIVFISAVVNKSVMRSLSDRIIDHGVGLLMYMLAIGLTYTMVQFVYILYDISVGGMCGYSQMREYPSPDKSRKIAVSLFDCGATTGFATNVSLHNADEVLQQEKPIYGDTDLGERIHDKTVLAYVDEHEIEVFWDNNRQVTLRYHGEKPVRQEAHMDGVTIRSEPAGK